jgi:mRNA-degrading endonuclease HigB of HigAB toxin-antitoxin module
MKKPINKETLKKAKDQIAQKSKIAYRLIKARYQKLNKRQRIALFAGNGAIILFFIALGISHHSSRARSTTAYPINFEAKSQVVKKPSAQPVIIKPNTQTLQLQSQLNDVKQDSSEQYNTMRAQLQTIQSNMSSLASEEGMQQLQKSITEPNKTLLGKMNHLQGSLKTIMKQTAKKTWVNPKTVEQSFRLVAVQGFSDGMRAIINVSGNQMTLSTHEISPACQGWVLQTMDFSNQSAVFAKQTKDQRLFVKLQAN